MTKLSNHQLFTLMFIFEIGSTTIFALGIGAKQDAWIVILIALVVGLVYMWVYTEIQNKFPDKNYVAIIKLILGNKLGVIVAIMYIVPFFRHASRNAREFGELIIITLLPEAPLLIIVFIFISTSIFIIIKGVDTMARLSEIFFYIIIFFMLFIYIFTYISGNVEFKELLPVLGEGIKPVLKELPPVIMFPFGETYVFLMYWNHAIEKNKVRKTGMKVIFFSGLLLCVSVIMDICVLGAEYTSIATVPFIEAMKLINIEGVISNIDAIGVMLIFIGGFFKMTIYLNAINNIICIIFKIKRRNISLLLLGCFQLWFVITFEPNYAYHKWLTNFETTYFMLIYSNVIPLFILFVYWMKRKRIEF
ncbi:GerAB/ArcD/ProY family transporter [Clostridium folliculivorans]|uniref:Germination protein GerKB n=1 Tax=Clostridium folliculivorans TaxID=2886038 RepID=A0A9W6D8Z5_9CLOT|nr:spore germination protein [Clostridium folliculivorans]GKU23252.1 germination protein GerKB [Clostridium folliculivorans]GKU29369.1 germination protein GerKB [Clostridium folliculivorans]